MNAPREPDDAERDTLADLHREASKAVDERPDPRVRERVLAAAREAEAFVRARDARQKARPARNLRAAWPKSVAAVLAVAVVTALVAGRLWPGRTDLDGAPTATASRGALVASNETAPKAEAPRPASPAPRTTVDGDAIARERRPDRRAFSRDRDEPVVVARRASPAAAPAPLEPAIIAPEPNVAPAPAGRAPPPPPAAAPKAMRPATSNDAFADSALGFAARSPEAWANAIVQLRRAGNDDAADAELKRLRESHPGFVVPAEALAPGERKSN